MRVKSALAAAMLLALLMPGSASAGKEGKPTEMTLSGKAAGKTPGMSIELPAPVLKSGTSLEEALARRRSVRHFTRRPLSINEVSQLLWAGQGESRNRDGRKPGHAYGLEYGRTAPSAGALYPLEIYIVAAEGLFQYIPKGHQLKIIASGDLRKELAAASLGQSCIEHAPASILIAGVIERTAVKYRGRAERYLNMEAGHAAQNILLEAVSLGLGGVPVGAFDDGSVQRALKLPRNHAPLLIIPVGEEG